MKKYVITEYEAEDIEELHSMNNEEVANTLEHIKRGYMPQTYVIHGEKGKTYSEDEYDNAKLHIAINKAILLLRELNKDVL